MSRVVDNRVVEMQFDNANFEKNVGTSLSTLDKLKAALNFKGVDSSFSSVESSANVLGKSFSMLEEVAIGSLRRIGSAVTEWATKTVKEMSGVNNMLAGFEKFSEITKSSATLVAQGFSNKEVERQLSRLNWFTDETSYKLDDMVSNISKFTASGQGLDESADAMMGIALWAALSGQNAQTASRAMYQLSQAMSTFMKREDWRSIQNANMDTAEFRQKALDAAVALKTLKKNANGTYTSLVKGIKAEGKQAFSASQFVESLTAGQWFTKDVMMSVYREYAGAVDQIYGYVKSHTGATVNDAIEALGDSLDEFGKKAFMAGQQARTWEDAVDSVKDALSTKWMGIFQLIFGNAEKATEFFTDLSYSFYDQFVEPMNARLAAFEVWADKFGAKDLKEGILEVLEAIYNITEKIRGAATDIFWSDKIEEVKESYKKTKKELGEMLAQAGKFISSEDDELSDEDALAQAKAEKMLKITSAFKSFADALLDASTGMSRFERIVKGIFAIVDLGKQAFMGLMSPLKELFSGNGSLKERVLETLATIGDFFVKLDKSAKKADAFKKAFTFILTPLINLKKAISDFAAAFKPQFLERWEKLKEKLSGLDFGFRDTNKSLTTFWESFKSKWLGLFKNFDADKAVDSLFNAFDRLKSWFYQITGMEPGTFFDHLQEAIYDTLDAFDDFKNYAKEKITYAWGEIKKVFNKAIEWAKTNKETIVTTFKGIFSGISNFFSGFWEGIKSLFSKKEDDGVSGFQKFVDSFKTIGKVFGTVISFIAQALAPLAEGLKKTFESMNADNAGDWLKGGGLIAIGIGIKKFAESLKKNSILSGISDILNGFGNVLDSFSHTLDAKALKEVAIAIAILVGALFVLISLPMDQVSIAGTVLAGVVGLIAMSIKQIASIQSSTTINAKGFSSSRSSGGMMFLEIAAGLLLIAIALKKISAIPTDALYTATFVIGALIGVITFAIKAIAKMYENKGDVKNVNIKALNPGFAGVLLGFALLLVSIALVIKTLVPIIEKHFTAFAYAMFTIMAVFVMMGIMAKLLSSEKEVSSDAWKMIAAMAALLYVVGVAVEKIASVGDLNAIAAAGGVIAAVMILMAIIVGIAKNGDFKGMKDLAGGLLLISVAVAIMAIIIAELAKTAKEYDLNQALLAVGLIALIFAGFAVLAGTDLPFFKFKPDNLMKMSKALIALSGAFVIMAAALWIVAQIPRDALLRAGVAMAGIAVVFALLSLLASTKVGEGMLTLGKTFVYIAGAIALLAAAFLLAAEAIRIFSDDSVDVKKAAKNISDFIDSILDNAGGWIMKIVQDIVAAAIETIAGSFLGVLDALETLFDELLANDKLKNVIDKACKVACAILDGITENIDSLVQSAGELIVTLLKSLGNWIQENHQKIYDALDSVISGLIEVILDLFNPLGEMIFGDSWQDIKDGIETVLKPALETFATVWLAKTFVGWVLSALGPISTAFSNLGLGLTSISGTITSLIAAHPVVATIAAGAAVTYGVAKGYEALQKAEAKKGDEWFDATVQERYNELRDWAEKQRKNPKSEFSKWNDERIQNWVLAELQAGGYVDTSHHDAYGNVIPTIERGKNLLGGKNSTNVFDHRSDYESNYLTAKQRALWDKSTLVRIVHNDGTVEEALIGNNALDRYLGITRSKLGADWVESSGISKIDQGGLATYTFQQNIYTTGQMSETESYRHTKTLLSRIADTR